MNILAFIFCLIFLQALCLGVSSCISKKNRTKEDYFLAGKNVKFFPLMMTLIATQIGGGTILGSAEEAYRIGWPVIFYPLGAFLGLVLLSLGVGKKMAQFPIATVAQIFEHVYGSPFLKKIASGLSILSLYIVLIGQLIASKKFMISLTFDHPVFFTLLWIIVIAYTVMGGLKGVISTDVVQALFFIAVFFGIFFVSFFSQSAESWSHFSEKLTVSGEISHLPLFSWLFMPLLFMVIEQDMGQRCFSAKSGKIVTRASACAGISVLLICVVPIYFGILGRTLDLAIPQGASVFMSVINQSFSPLVVTLIACAVIIAIISTANSLLNAISSNITQDFLTSSPQQQVFWGRTTSFLLGISAIVLSFLFSDILALFMLSYELSVSCLFIPVMYAIFMRKGTLLSAVLSILGGMIGFILFRNIEVGIPRELASLLLSCGGFILGIPLKKVLAKKEAQITA